MSELNQLYYGETDKSIENYLKNDHSGRAIMLSGKWGTGKSHYVRTELKKYIQDLGYKVVIVSLYGLTDISEISKAIYIELRTIKKQPKSEAGNNTVAVGKIIGKTVFNGLVNKIGFDIGKINDKDLQKVYKSVDLSNKLIIFEDFERAKIDVTELLGYINNMCEVDGTKILLVANEYAIGKEYYYSRKEDRIQFKLTRKYADYKKIKEKTIGDTIKFECNFEHTIKKILPEYNIPVTEIVVKGIIEVLQTTGQNLRSFQFACQKYSEIKKLIGVIYRLDTKIDMIIFNSIIAYIQLRDNGADIKYEKNSIIFEIVKGPEVYRLFKFCYDYIKYQRFNNEAAIQQLRNYNEYCRCSKWNKNQDADLHIIKSYRLEKADDVKKAIKNIHSKIDSGEITYWDYPELLCYLISIKNDVNIDSKYIDISDIMIKRLKQAENKDKISNDLFTISIVPIGGAEEYKDMIQKMKDALKVSNLTINVDNSLMIEQLTPMERADLAKKIADEGFSKVFDINIFCSSLENCSSKRLYYIGTILVDAYDGLADMARIDEDEEELRKIKEKVDELKVKGKYDEIQKRNYERISEIIYDRINGLVDLEEQPDDGIYIYD